MTLQIVNQSQARVPRKFLVDFVLKATKKLKRKGALSENQSALELTLVFLEKGPAKKLNSEFRGKNYATDVLSFESLEPESLGELIMCPEVLKTQAREHSLSFREELCYMVLHGMLHLLGFEHENGGKEAERMFQLQDEVFESVLD